VATLPRDRSKELQRAKEGLEKRVQERKDAEAALAQARETLEQSSRRRFGRRNRLAIDGARRGLGWAEERVARALTAEAEQRRVLKEERAAQAEHQHALAETAPERGQLERSVRELEASLEVTRPGRVAAMAEAGIAPAHLQPLLGDPPEGRAGRMAWCHLAARVEAYRDHHVEDVRSLQGGTVEVALGRRLDWLSPWWAWEAAAADVSDARSVITLADDLGPPRPGHSRDPAAWVATVAEARHALDAVRPVSPSRAPGLDRGLDLGW
jgi:hypothetical protein